MFSERIPRWYALALFKCLVVYTFWNFATHVAWLANIPIRISYAFKIIIIVNAHTMDISYCTVP